MKYNIKLKTITIKVREQRENYGDVSNPREVAEVLKGIYKNLDDDQEHFGVLFLNNKNRITGFKMLFSGGQAFSQIDIKVLFRNTLLFGAINIILFHNHPSGDPSPSEVDQKVTKKIKQAAEVLDIKVLDHIIIGNYGNYYSFANNNLL